MAELIYVTRSQEQGNAKQNKQTNKQEHMHSGAGTRKCNIKCTGQDKEQYMQLAWVAVCTGKTIGQCAKQNMPGSGMHTQELEKLFGEVKPEFQNPSVHIHLWRLVTQGGLSAVSTKTVQRHSKSKLG